MVPAGESTHNYKRGKAKQLYEKQMEEQNHDKQANERLAKADKRPKKKMEGVGQAAQKHNETRCCEADGPFIAPLRKFASGTRVAMQQNDEETNPITEPET